MKLKIPFSASITIAFGLIVLAGYFVQLPDLNNLQQILLLWSIPLAAVALMVGIVNLFAVHWRKASTGQKGSLYSALLMFSLLATLVIAGYFGPASDLSLWIFNYIQVPVETSLVAILTVALAFAAIRLLRKRLNGFSLIFLVTVLFMLLGAAPLFGVEIPGLLGPFGARSLLEQVPVIAGARGILLGIALGSIATGLRVLMGVDRPYRG